MNKGINRPITDTTAADFLKNKQLQPTSLSSTEIASLWNDEAKARSFFSARVASADMLEAMRTKITRVVEGKIGSGDARHWIRQFLETDGASALQASGFMLSEDAKETDKLTELASTRRLNLIIDQNVRMARAVGELRAMADDADIFPYVEYRTREDNRVRNSHALLDRKVFKVRDPIMAKIVPPQDFRCRCYLRQITEDELNGRTADKDLPKGWIPPESGFSFDATRGLAVAIPNKPSTETLLGKAMRDYTYADDKRKRIINGERQGQNYLYDSMIVLAQGFSVPSIIGSEVKFGPWLIDKYLLGSGRDNSRPDPERLKHLGQAVYAVKSSGMKPLDQGKQIAYPHKINKYNRIVTFVDRESGNVNGFIYSTAKDSNIMKYFHGERINEKP